MSGCYPSTPDSALRLPAYWEELKAYDVDAVIIAMSKAMAASPSFLPTAPQIAAIATPEHRRILLERAEGQLSLMLPADVDRNQILHDFYSACDRADVSMHELAERDEVILGGIVKLLTRYYHHCDDPDCERSGHNKRCDENARIFVNDFKQRGFEAIACVRGMKKSPSIFAVSPTIGGIQALIRNEPIGSWPEGWLKPAASNEPQTSEAYRDWKSTASGEEDQAND